VATATDTLEAFRPMLVAVARALVSKRHSLDLDDLVQVGFLAIHRCSAKDVPDRGSFPAYARTRARYAMIDAIRDSGLIRVPRAYHGEAGSHLTGAAATAAHDMLARHFVGDSQLGDDLSLAEIVVDDRPNIELEESPPMSRLNGSLDHATTATEAEANLPDRRCAECGNRFKSAHSQRCYTRGCSRSGFPAKVAKGKPGPKPKGVKATPAPDPVVRPSAPASSIVLELRLMAEIASLPCDARSRLTAWVAALPR
jgi:hypothetical protein